MDTKILLFLLCVVSALEVNAKGGHSSHSSHSHHSHSHGGHSGGHHDSHRTGHGDHGSEHSSGGFWSRIFGGTSSSKKGGSTHTYPRSDGLSGSSRHYYVPTVYHRAPQVMYVHQYAASNSRYNDLLTGLSLYNLERSNHHSHHYYNDDFYRSRYTYRPSVHTTRSEYDAYETPKEDAACTLRVQQVDQVNLLKIPCEIVSTFTEVNRTVTTGHNATLHFCNDTVENVTNCINATDPLTVTEIPQKEELKTCSVEIRTKYSQVQNDVDCQLILKYAKEDENAIIPSRDTLYSWFANPPWWLSVFISV